MNPPPEDDPLGLFVEQKPTIRSYVPQLAALAIVAAAVVALVASFRADAVVVEQPVNTSNQIPSTFPWTDTFTDIAGPTRVLVSGQITANNANNDDLAKQTGPNGWREEDIPTWFFTKGYQGKPYPSRLVPELPYMAVIGRVGSGKPFLVGEGRVLEPAEVGRGRLWLGINDVSVNMFGQEDASEFANNGGAFSYKIESVQ